MSKIEHGPKSASEASPRILMAAGRAWNSSEYYNSQGATSAISANWE